MASKDTWIITFGSLSEENGLFQPEPTWPTLSPLHSSRQANQKAYIVCLIWRPDELIMIFSRFPPETSQAKSA